MKKLCFILAVITLLAASIPSFVFGEDQYPGFSVQGRFLYDKDGEKVIPYGVNEMSIWGDIDGDVKLPEIKRLALILLDLFGVLQRLQESWIF